MYLQHISEKRSEVQSEESSNLLSIFVESHPMTDDFFMNEYKQIDTSVKGELVLKL